MRFFLILFFLWLSFLASSPVHGQAFVPDSVAWVDSVLQSLTLEQKIAQLLNIRAYSNRDEVYAQSIDSIILKYNIGGLTFFQGGPIRQAHLTNRWQKLACTPLFIAIDAETGVGMRLDSVPPFPDPMTLGAANDDSLTYRIGQAIGRQCRRLGIHINFAPVADVNNNPLNPVINQRSFGEDPVRVARLAEMMTRGIQSQGVIATLKHFPGHGDTDSDSHYTLPVIRKDKETLEQTEFLPFLHNAGIAHAVMTAHLFVPSLDSSQGIPTSLSPPVVQGILREKMGFGGLIITDALDMKGADRFQEAGEKELRAFLAGNDILLLPTDIPSAIAKIRAACDSGLISTDAIETRCKKILAYKYSCGLANYQPVATEGLTPDLYTSGDHNLVKEVFRKAITVIQNRPVVPLKPREYDRIAYIPVYSESEQFSEGMQMVFPHERIPWPDPGDTPAFLHIRDTLKYYSLKIITLIPPSIFASRNYGLTEKALARIRELCSEPGSVLVVLGNPYAMSDSLGATVVQAYQNHPLAAEAVIHILYGALAASGKLPVTAGLMKKGDGNPTTTQQVLGFATPLEMGMDPVKLDKIEDIVQEGMQKGAFPGCQVLIARNGKTVYYKAFGYLDINKTEKVKPTSLYDIASITKIAATTLMAMRLYDENRISPETHLGDLLTNLHHRRIKKIQLSDILYHQAGFFPWLPYYKATLHEGSPSSVYYRKTPEPGFTLPVARDLYLRNDYPDTIIRIIENTPLSKSGTYQYSDLGFILLRLGFERRVKIPFEAWLEDEIYRQIGVSSLMFNPLRQFPANRIAPTLVDTEFRKQLLRGHVHDPAAAMLGGVSGHAGLFSHAFDLARIMQMLLWEGSYDGQQILKAETVALFTASQKDALKNRRAMGFDKPPIPSVFNGPVCQAASPKSFGHSGFTGTYAWADPENGLIYIFLSNRIHPSDENNLLNILNIRTRIHQAAYESLLP